MADDLPAALNDTGLPSRLDALASALAQAETIGEVDQIKGRARAIAAMSRHINEMRDIHLKAVEVQLLAMRREGAEIIRLRLAKAVPPHIKDRKRARATLAELNITPVEASQTRRLAQIPDEMFEQWLQAQREARQISVAAALRLAAGLHPRPVFGPRVDGHHEAERDRIAAENAGRLASKGCVASFALSFGENLGRLLRRLSPAGRTLLIGRLRAAIDKAEAVCQERDRHVA